MHIYIYIYIYMQPMHSREIFQSKKQNQASTKEGKYFHRAPIERNINYRTTSGPETKKKQQHKVGTATEHTSVLPEESGGQATTLSSA